MILFPERVKGLIAKRLSSPRRTKDSTNRDAPLPSTGPEPSPQLPTCGPAPRPGCHPLACLGQDLRWGRRWERSQEKEIQVSLLASILGLKGFKHLALLEFHIKISKL